MELRRLVQEQDVEIERLSRHICDLQDWHAEDLTAVRAAIALASARVWTAQNAATSRKA